MADQAGWQRAVEAELRELGRELDVPPAASLTAAVRQRLEGPAARRPHPARRREGILRLWRPGWRAALVVVAVLLAVLVATPQGRAVVTHVLRFAGIELQQEPGPAPSPRSAAALPGERRMPLAEARRHVSFPILVPAALGRPSEVVVSDGGRVVSLIYRRTPHGLVRMDEFAGHLDPVFFQKFIHFGDVTQVRVNGLQGLVDQGPARAAVHHPRRHTGRGLGPAHHRQHPDLGHPAGRAAPGRQPQQDDSSRHRQLGALTPRRHGQRAGPAPEPATGVAV